MPEQSPTSRTIVVLVRHGQSEHNALGAISTRGPGPDLTELGREQAAVAGESLAGRGVTRVYSSNLVRARASASIIGGILRTGPEVVEEDLREVDAGDLEGCTGRADYERLDAAFVAWRREELEVRIGATGETGREMRDRLARVLRTLGSRHPGETIVAVAHGGLLEIGLPLVVDNLPSTFREGEHLANGACVEAAVDAHASIRSLRWGQQASAPVAVDP